MLFFYICLTIWDTITAFLQSVLFSLTHICLLLFVIPFCINSTWDHFSSVRWTPLISFGMGLHWLTIFVYIVSSSLKHIFTTCGILVWWLFSFSTLKMSFPLSPVFLVAEKWLLWGGFTWRSSEFFPLTALKILSLVFHSLTVVCVCVDFFLFMWLGNCQSLLVCGLMSFIGAKIFSAMTSSHDASPSFSHSFPWTPSSHCIRHVSCSLSHLFVSQCYILDMFFSDIWFTSSLFSCIL